MFYLKSNRDQATSEIGYNTNDTVCDEGPGVFAKFMALGSLLIVLASLPVSLFFVVKVVQVCRSTRL